MIRGNMTKIIGAEESRFSQNISDTPTDTQNKIEYLR